MSQRSWFWQIEAIGQDPDYVFSAIDASEAEPLRAGVEQHCPASYVHHIAFISPADRGCCLYQSYLDRHTADRFIETRQSGTQENIYCYGRIEVCDHKLYIKNILAGGNYGETDRVIAVAKAPDLT